VKFYVCGLVGMLIKCSLHITLFNKNSWADVQISIITVRIQELRDVFIQKKFLKDSGSWNWL